MQAHQAPNRGTLFSGYRGREARTRLQKAIPLLLMLLMAYSIVRDIVAATVNPLFNDEILTQIVASQPTANAIWDALARGIDSHPPLFYLVEGFSLKLYSNPHIALRLPAILAFPCIILCVFVYLRNRYKNDVGFLSSTFLMTTSVFLTHGANARAYGMVMACMSLALVCYQRVSSPFWTVMLAVALALGEALHYFTIFSMLPFGVAELVYSLQSRKVRWRVWTALTFGAVPLIMCWPLLSNLRSHYGPHYFVHFGLSSIPVIYGQFLFTGAALGTGLVAACVAAVVSARFLRGEQHLDAERLENNRVEGALLLTLLALPLTTYAVAKIMHGTLADRYVLTTVLGLALSLACVMSLAKGKALALFAFFILAVAGIHELSFWRSLHSLQLDNPAESVQTFVEKVGAPDLPVAVPDGLTFLELSY